MHLAQIKRFKRDQPVCNGIVQVTVFSLAAVSGTVLRLSLMRVAVVPLFQNASLQTKLRNIPSDYFTGSATTVLFAEPVVAEKPAAKALGTECYIGRWRFEDTCRLKNSAWPWWRCRAARGPGRIGRKH